jgi:short-subunit dehydrogenase
VTGASAGIGKVFCERLAARGYDLIAVARDGSRLAALGDELGRRHGVLVEPFVADLSRDGEIDGLVEWVRGSRPLAVLINNAGFGTDGPLAQAAPGPQAAMLHLHTLAPMRVTQAALPGMLTAGTGWIVNVSSVASFLYSPGNVNYCATKAYLTTFSEGLATELAGTGVRVQALCPGFTHSEFHERMGMDKRRAGRAPWLTAEAVVDASLAAIARGGPVVCVPGTSYKVFVALLHLLPRSWIGRLTRRRATDH